MKTTRKPTAKDKRIFLAWLDGKLSYHQAAKRFKTSEMAARSRLASLAKYYYEKGKLVWKI